ncbi:MAG: argininosuccinate lyase [Phycisphaerales bacterium]|nr:argininosuccinate lyase [Phycisphaerales bacterium]
MSSGQKSWQARISGEPDAIAQEFVESVSYDWRLYRQDIAGSIAHAMMLAKVGLISRQDCDAIVTGLKQIESEIDRDGAGWAGFRKELEDIHMCIETELIRRIGEPGRKLHTGRSRNDQVALDLSEWIISAALSLRESIRRLQEELKRLAIRSADIVMPGYTHLQRAQPIQAAAEAHAWWVMFDRDVDRLQRAFDRSCEPARQNLDSPLGSGALAGTSLPIDADFSASLLNYPSGPRSSMEQTASRDRACEFLFACAMIAQHLSRFAEQWIIYMSSEFGFLRIADRYTTSSSMMPQKRNPDMLELIRGRCGNVYGDLFALMTILKGLPIGYNRDLQEDKRIVFRAFDTVSQCLTMAAAIVNSAEFDRQRIESTLDRGFLDATSLAEYLVTRGIPFRTAHHIVGTLVAQCERQHKEGLHQLTVAEFNQAIESAEQLPGASGTQLPRVDADVYRCLGARNVVQRYQSSGAAGGRPLEAQLQAWREQSGDQPATPKNLQPGG